jgi:2-amino-4-hydroxy-6-hydroxymethyldihydropteridine diphosphokinase
VAFVYVSIGSNVHVESNVCSCIRHIRNDFRKTVFSSIYQTPAEGFAGDPFLNLVSGFATSLSPEDLRHYLKKLEALHGRRHTQEKFSPRTLDIDLLLYDKLNLLPDIRIPHPDITAYPFVLFPLAEIAPDAIHPVLQQSISRIAADSGLSREKLQRVELDCSRHQA